MKPVNRDVKVASAVLPTRFGMFRMYGFRYRDTEAAALVVGDPTSADAPLVRVHSQCLTGEAFGSLRCDCGLQLEAALRSIQEEGCGVLIYLFQEGRGIGLFNKVRVYDLQDQGFDTVDANLQLGFAPDLRKYQIACLVLRHFGVRRLRLISNNPQKIQELSDAGLTVVARVFQKLESHQTMNPYLATKRERMGHLL